MTLDVTKAIEPRSDQQNADDYLAGPETVTIESVEVNQSSEQPVWVHLKGKKGKPWKPSKTALRCLALVWGADASKWSGLSLTLYNDPDVTWGGMKVGGIRVSHMEGLTEARTLMLTKTRGKKGATVIKPLLVEVGGARKQEPESTIDTTALFADARENAEMGKDAMRAWWGTKNKEEQALLKSILPELQDIAGKADAGGGDE